MSEVWLVHMTPWRETYAYSSEESAYKAAWHNVNRALKGKEEGVEFVSIEHGMMDGHNEVEEVFLYSIPDNERMR